ncbi:MAG: SUMF1/EgtB/PvdO family nonheme iron enzyme, partial [Armatimonadetes bacterium]|nr:SUMF1/EgtB/PvdO family nonheme iron enzyme [Armatimonadota bacterium]
ASQYLPAARGGAGGGGVFAGHTPCLSCCRARRLNGNCKLQIANCELAIRADTTNQFRDRLQRRVLRGGAWNNNNLNRLRCANRNNNDPDNRNNNRGFRCAQDLVPPRLGSQHPVDPRPPGAAPTGACFSRSKPVRVPRKGANQARPRFRLVTRPATTQGRANVGAGAAHFFALTAESGGRFVCMGERRTMQIDN